MGISVITVYIISSSVYLPTCTQIDVPLTGSGERKYRRCHAPVTFTKLPRLCVCVYVCMCSWARTLDLVHIFTAVGWVDISDTLLPFPELPVCFGNAEADPSQYAPSQVVSQRGPGTQTTRVRSYRCILGDLDAYFLWVSCSAPVKW